MRPADAVSRGGADGPPLAAAVPFALFGPGGCREVRVRAGQGLHGGLQQRRLVGLDDHQVVRVLVLDQVAGGFRLRMQGVQGDHLPGEVQVRDGGGQLRNLIGLGVYLPLGAHRPGGHVENRQQVHLAAIAADRAADGLAVSGRLRQQARRAGCGGCPGGAALLTLMPGDLGKFPGEAGRQGGEVAAHRRVERLRVDAAEDPRERARAWRADPPGPRVAPPAQSRQRGLRAAGRPLGDRRRRVVPGCGERADRKGQHEHQRMPATQPRPRIRDAGQPFPQAAPRPVSGKNPRQLAGRSVDQGR